MQTVLCLGVFDRRVGPQLGRWNDLIGRVLERKAIFYVPGKRIGPSIFLACAVLAGNPQTEEEEETAYDTSNLLFLIPHKHHSLAGTQKPPEASISVPGGLLCLIDYQTPVCYYYEW